MARSYDAPLINLVGCLANPLGPIAIYNFMAIIQTLLILGISYWATGPYIRNRLLRVLLSMVYFLSGFSVARQGYHLNLLSTLWGVPLVFRLFDQLNPHKYKAQIIAWTALGMTFIGTWQNISNLTFLALFLYLKAIRFSVLEFKKTLKALMIGLLVMFLAIMPLMGPMLLSTIGTNFGNNLQEGQILTLWQYLVPYYDHPFYSVIPKFIKEFTSLEMLIGIDWLLAGLIVPASIRLNNPKKRYWLMLILFYVLLTTRFRTFNFLVLYDWLPLSLTRIPARIGVVTLWLVTFLGGLYFDQLTQALKRFGRYIPLIFAGYVIVYYFLWPGTPTYPTIEWKRELPIHGLEEIRQTENALVLQAPIGIAKDATQNFLQLFHQKPLVNGYISYAAENPVAIKRLEQGEAYYYFDCKDYGFSHIESIDTSFADYAITLLSKEKIIHIIINKNPSPDNCTDFNHLERLISLSTRAKLIEDTDKYAIYSIKEDFIQDGVILASMMGIPADAKAESRKINDQTIVILSDQQKKVRYKLLIEAEDETAVSLMINSNIIEKFRAKRTMNKTGTLDLALGRNYLRILAGCLPDEPCLSLIEFTVEQN